MSVLKYISGPTGGWQYHFAALRYRHSAWSAYLRTVELWLESWQPPEKKLVIFGPSAGWSLPRAFLQKFEHVTFVEPDPLARFLLHRRFRGLASAGFVSDVTILPWFDARGGNWSQFLSEHAAAAILFSNLLGQLKLMKCLRGDVEGEFLAALRGRSWASYHDLLSSDAAVISERAEFSPTLGVAALACSVFIDHAQVTDHETAWLSEGQPTPTVVWKLRPRQTHVIGFVSTQSTL